MPDPAAIPEAEALERQARELEEEIARARARLAVLAGRPRTPGSETTPARWRDWLEHHVEHRFGSADVRATSAASIEAILRDTCTVGRVRIEDGALEWRGTANDSLASLRIALRSDREGAVLSVRRERWPAILAKTMRLAAAMPTMMVLLVVSQYFRLPADRFWSFATVPLLLALGFVMLVAVLGWREERKVAAAIGPRILEEVAGALRPATQGVRVAEEEEDELDERAPLRREERRGA
jgi:hypothetical protein